MLAGNRWAMTSMPLVAGCDAEHDYCHGIHPSDPRRQRCHPRGGRRCLPRRLHPRRRLPPLLTSDASAQPLLGPVRPPLARGLTPRVPSAHFAGFDRLNQRKGPATIGDRALLVCRGSVCSRPCGSYCWPPVSFSRSACSASSEASEPPPSPEGPVLPDPVACSEE